MSAGAIMSIASFASIPLLTRRFSEVKVMIWGGFLLMLLGRISFIPLVGNSPHIYEASFKLNLSLYCEQLLKHQTTDLDLDALNCTLSQYGKWINLNETNQSIIRNMTFNCGEDLLGCPSNQKWCYNTPRMSIIQFLIGVFLTSLGYPIGVTLIQSIFSKLLGSKPQVRQSYKVYSCSTSFFKHTNLITFYGNAEWGLNNKIEY